jgi:dienelactone hydrolase
VDVESGAVTRPAGTELDHTKPVFTPDGKAVLVLVEESRVTHVSRVDLASNQVTPLTSGPRFDFDFDVAANGRIAVLGGDDLHPYRIEAVEPKGLRVVAEHNEWLKNRKLAPVEEISFKSADGTSIDGFLVKPLDYVPGKHYPTIVRIHGGPVYQFSHEFMEDWQVFAANGYAVVAANPRGSSGRGFEFAKAIYADWGSKDGADVIAAVDHVVSMGISDPDRIGVGGHSYGGILTDELIARSDRFKAAVSSAGSGNMYGMYGFDMYIREYEQELGLPWRDREAYDRASYPFLHADRIKTPTLFLCEELDQNVPCIGAMQMYQALKSQGVPTRLVIYPGEYHPVTIPSYLKDRMERLLDWYGRYLGVAPRAAVALQQRDESVVRQRLRAVALVAHHVARRHHRVHDRFFGRLRGCFEQRVQISVIQEFRGVNFRAVHGFRVRRRKRDEDVARTVAREGTHAGEPHAGALRDAIELIRQQRRIGCDHDDDRTLVGVRGRQLARLRLLEMLADRHARDSKRRAGAVVGLHQRTDYVFAAPRCRRGATMFRYRT